MNWAQTPALIKESSTVWLDAGGLRNRRVPRFRDRFIVIIEGILCSFLAEGHGVAEQLA
jgi:hypothetical protein